MLTQFVKGHLAHCDVHLSAGVFSFLSEAMLTLSPQSDIFVVIQTGTGAACGFGVDGDGLCVLFRCFWQACVMLFHFFGNGSSSR